jgi:Cytochrome P460
MRKYYKAFVLAAVVTIGLSAPPLTSEKPLPQKQSGANAAQSDSDLLKLAKYKEWTLVNPEPVLMDPQVAAMCAAPTLSRVADNPHFNKYLSVFVNQEGREAMMAKREPTFPVGSMIVKQKLSANDSTTPELLTAMLKREKGYNPDSGDWEYLLLDGTASKIVERGKLDSCNACHKMYKKQDYVTRLYLPQSVAKDLK